jgi:hypothetical protein
MTLTPYLILVFAGYAAFMLPLAVIWTQNYAADRRAARSARL